MTGTQFTRLVKDVQANGFTDPVVKYTVINDTPYVVLGNNSVMAARQLNRLGELRFEKVELPLEGTNWNTAEDVLNAGYIKQPKYRGN